MTILNAVTIALIATAVFAHVRMERHSIYDPASSALAARDRLDTDTLMFRSIWGAVKWASIGALVALNLARLLLV